jgi:hypothetical protein
MLRWSTPVVVGGGQAVGQRFADSLLFRAAGANFNTTSDQALTKQGTFSQYVISQIVVLNASIPLTTAVGGIYAAAAKVAPVVVAANQAYSGLTNGSATLTPPVANTDKRTEAGLFLSLTTPQGAAATADVLVYGYAVA